MTSKNAGSTTYRHCPPVMRGTDKVTQETCRYCKEETPLSECLVPAHWETRLKNCRLSADRASDKRIDHFDDEGVRVRVTREVQMSRDADLYFTRALVLPQDAEVAEVFALDSFGVSYPKAPSRFWPNPDEQRPAVPHKTYRMGAGYGTPPPPPSVIVWNFGEDQNVQAA